MGKEKIARNEQFLHSHCVFYPFVELSSIFIPFEFVVCKLFQFDKVQNLSFAKGLRTQFFFVRVENMRNEENTFFQTASFLGTLKINKE